MTSSSSLETGLALTSGCVRVALFSASRHLTISQVNHTNIRAQEYGISRSMKPLHLCIEHEPAAEEEDALLLLIYALNNWMEELSSFDAAYCSVLCT